MNFCGAFYQAERGREVVGLLPSPLHESLNSVCLCSLAYWNANEARTPARATQNKKPGQIPPSALHHFVLHVRT